jgi:hypothetical protein
MEFGLARHGKPKRCAALRVNWSHCCGSRSNSRILSSRENVSYRWPDLFQCGNSDRRRGFARYGSGWSAPARAKQFGIGIGHMALPWSNTEWNSSLAGSMCVPGPCVGGTRLVCSSATRTVGMRGRSALDRWPSWRQLCRGAHARVLHGSVPI